MTEEQTALARRAVACKGFRWLPGMRWRFDVTARVGIWSRYEGDDACDDDGNVVRESEPEFRGPAIPDLTDPATLGCLLALVREAWEPQGVPISTHCYHGEGWSIQTLPMPMFTTEAEALVAALEAASTTIHDSPATGGEER